MALVSGGMHLCVSAHGRIVKQNRNLFVAKLGYYVACYLDDRNDSALLSVLNTINDSIKSHN